MNKVLVVDDNDLVRYSICINLEAHGFSPINASSGREAIRILRKEKPVSVILDLKMPEMDGLETLKNLKKIDADVPVIINTGHGDIATAVEAIKLGAYDFIVKPPDFERLALTLKRASENFALNKKVKVLNKDVEKSLGYLCGKSEVMKQVIHQIHRISHSSFSLIIQGETGTGKSFISHVIHNLSKRAGGPFVSIDIGAIPETLVESELFGHEKGAFTGAEKKKKGYFEMADGGTLLIDELQNLSPYVQIKLLKAVEDKSITPLGSTSPVKTDVRIIGATNADILESVREKKSFREDLFYRLSEAVIILPPLRKRTEDIPFLAEKFFRDASEDLHKPVHTISENAYKLLIDYPWPGNIRELKNVIRRAVLFTGEETIKPEHLEFFKDAETTPAHKDIPMSVKPSSMNLMVMEKETIKQALNIANGNKKQAASMLHIGYTTLFRKIKQYSL